MESGLLLDAKLPVGFKLDAKTKHNPEAREIADKYAQSKGLKPLKHDIKPELNEVRAKEIAKAYEEMKHEPNSPKVKKAYDALIKETEDQYKHLKKHGLKVTPIAPGQENPYKSSADMVRDVKENKHLHYYPTDQGFGEGAEGSDHPLLKKTSEHANGKPMLANDMFRVVHDYFGHAKEGTSFGPKGEEHAWKSHMQMYTPEAQKALTSETRGQNSWVNFGPHGEENRKNPANTKYAEQKAGILPDFAMEKESRKKFADGGMAMPAGFSLDSAPNAIPDSTPQSLTGQPADQTPQSSSLPAGFQLDEDRYSGAWQTAQAAVEGALGPLAGPGQSLPGTAGMLKSGLGIGSNEAIRARAETHPIAHIAGELAGLVAGPEGAGLEATGIGALEGAGLRAPTTFAAKVGSAAVKNAAEFAAYNGFDQVTKSIQEDPNVGAESFLANVGLGAALGGGLGVLGAGVVSPLWKATVGSELAGQMKVLVSHFGGTEEAAEGATKGLTKAQELEQQTGVAMPKEIANVVDGTPGAMQNHSILSQTDNTMAGRAYQKILRDHNEMLENKAIESLGGDASGIENLPKKDKYTTGNNAGEALVSDLEPEVKAINDRYETTNAEFKASPIWHEDQRVIADQISQLATEEGWHKAESDTQQNLANKVMGKMKEQQTVEDLKKFITNLSDAHPYGSDTYQAAKKIRNILKDNQERIISENIARAGGDANGKLAEYTQLRSDYSKLMTKIDNLNEHLHVGRYDGPGSFLQALKEMSTTNGEGVLNRLSGKNKANVLEQLKQFPNALKAIKDYHVHELLENAVKKAPPGKRISLGALLKGVNDLSPQLQELVANPEQHKVMQGIQQTAEALHDPTHNFSNTARTVSKMLGDNPSALSFIAAMMGHAGAGAAAYIGKLGFTESKDAVRLGMLRFLGSGKPINAEGLKATVSYLSKATKTAKQLNTAAENVFKPGAMVLLPTMKASPQAITKLDKLVASNDPKETNQILSAQSNSLLGHYSDKDQAAVSQASTAQLQYLKSLKPQPIQHGPLDTPMAPTQEQEARYQDALQIAHAPAIVFQKIKDGTATVNDIKDLNSMFPALSKQFSGICTNQMAGKTADQEPIPYKTRMGCSLFLGQAMDSTMQPAAIQAAQLVFAPKQPPQQPQGKSGGKKGTSTLGKSNASYKTPNQAAESDRGNRD